MSTSYRDLREFIQLLEQRDLLRRVSVPVSPNPEMTEICDRVLRAGGPAVLFESVSGSDIPVLGNLYLLPSLAWVLLFAGLVFPGILLLIFA